MNIVIDIETLSLKTNAAILSIGAVAENGKSFYVELDWRYQGGSSFHISEEVLSWWNEQTTQCPLHGTMLPGTGLTLLRGFIQAREKEAEKAPKIWARGPQFDIVVLEHAFDFYGMEKPWHYKNIRDIRTALDLIKPETPIIEPTQKHHAEADAIADMKNLAARGIVNYVEPQL